MHPSAFLVVLKPEDREELAATIIDGKSCGVLKNGTSWDLAIYLPEPPEAKPVKKNK